MSLTYRYWLIPKSSRISLQKDLARVDRRKTTLCHDVMASFTDNEGDMVNRFLIERALGDIRHHVRLLQEADGIDWAS